MNGVPRLALIIALAAAPAAAADRTTSSQLWGEVDLSADFASDWHVTALTVARAGDGLPNPTLWGGGVIVDRRFGDVTLSGGDLGVIARSPVSGSRASVNVPLAAVSYEWKIAGFVLSDRNRFEELLHLPGDPWRYRNRLSAEHHIEGPGPISSVFASEEAFFDFRARQWQRSRAQAGLGVTVSHNAELRLYYLRQDDSSSLPRAVNGLGVTLALELD